MYRPENLKNQIDLHVSKVQEVGRLRLEVNWIRSLINKWILSQLDVIGKRLTAIEQGSASAARPKAKKILLGVLLDQVSMEVFLRVIQSKNYQNCTP